MFSVVRAMGEPIGLVELFAVARGIFAATQTHRERWLCKRQQNGAHSLHTALGYLAACHMTLSWTLGFKARYWQVNCAAGVPSRFLADWTDIFFVRTSFWCCARVFKLDDDVVPGAQFVYEWWSRASRRSGWRFSGRSPVKNSAGLLKIRAVP